MTNVKVVILGAKGRMGCTLVSCAKADPELDLVGEIDVGDDIKQVLDTCDAIVDFSVAEATDTIAEEVAKCGKALVIGTTGHSAEQKKKVKSFAERIPIVWSANFSTGVNTLFWATGKVAEILGESFDVEIVEAHHTGKKDAPSGTAKRLQEVLAEVRGNQPPAHSMRIGDVVGDHTVYFAAAGERIELTHRASSRDTFARGALRAAKWAVQQKPGLYDMQDVLGLR